MGSTEAVKERKKLTERVPSLGIIFQVIEPHNAGDAHEATQQKQQTHANLLVLGKMQAPHNGDRHHQDQDIRHNVTHIRESCKRPPVNTMTPWDCEIPKIRNRRALKSETEDADDAQGHTEDHEQQVAKTPCGGCILPGE